MLVAVGITLFWWANQRRGPLDFGWTAYTPLQPGEAVPVVLSGDGTLLWTRGHLVGAGLAVVGLLVLAALTGWWVGRRRGGSTSSGAALSACRHGGLQSGCAPPERNRCDWNGC